MPEDGATADGGGEGGGASDGAGGHGSDAGGGECESGAGGEDGLGALPSEPPAPPRAVRPPPPSLRTNRTRRVLHPVLIGHAASFTRY